MATIRVGVVGAGKHGQRYVRHCREDVPELELVAICRQDEARGRVQARELGCTFYGDYHALVADPRVEAVVAAVPPTLHDDLAECAARAGKALVLEKPLAASTAAARRVRQAVEESGIPFLMAHTLRWNTVVQEVRAHLPSLGELQALYLNQRFEPSPLAWLDDPERSGGGILLHTGVHSFDLVRLLTGAEVSRVYCRTSRSRTHRTEDNFVAALELEGRPGLMVAVSGSRSTLGRSGLIDIAGSEGQLVADHALHTAYKVRGLERTPLSLPPPVPTVREVLRSLVRLLRAGEPGLASLLDGYRAVAVAEACARSAQSGLPEEVEPTRDPR